MFKPYALIPLYIITSKRKKRENQKKKIEKERKKKSNKKGTKCPNVKFNKNQCICVVIKREYISMWKSEEWVVGLALKLHRLS